MVEMARGKKKNNYCVIGIYKTVLTIRKTNKRKVIADRFVCNLLQSQRQLTYSEAMHIENNFMDLIK